ncbi:nitrate/nitrite transporter [Parapedomonas caeni]|jgi:NNP family nitrate/nitrite transporter-like MFS transporter
MDHVEGAGPGEPSRILGVSTLAFTVCFAVWTIFAIIGIELKAELGLSDTQFGLLVGTPILTGSLIRVVLGIWTDQYGGRRVFTLVMLAAAAATWALTHAQSYGQLLVAALGVGIAGGSFAVGIAYVSRWYPPQQQGTALGVFGAGNVGAAVTKFLAPFVMVAFGWQRVAEIWAAALVVMAIIFWLATRDDPQTLRMRAQGRRAPGTLLQLEPLKNIQVWRFALYYFFVFGAFVALALWLPHYLTDVYKVDIRAAGMLGALYSIPASLFRAYGGHLSDRYGARSIMYFTFIVSGLCLFLLAYPPATYSVHTLRGDVRFSLAMGLVPFLVLMFTLGFAMSLGKAAVYKHIPVYYPDHVGAVGGLVGMIGGLGGFLLPIAFGALLDATGIWTSCFMLLFLLVATALVWMHVSIRQMERRAAERGIGITALPELPEMQPVHGPAQAGRLGPRALGDWRPEDPVFWRTGGRAIARRNLMISIPALLLAFAVWMVWSVVVTKLPLVGFDYTTDQLFWLAALPGLSGATLRIFYSFMVPIFGGRLWTTLSTLSLLLPAAGIGMAVQNPDTPYIVFLGLALLCGFGGGNFASSMANIGFFFPRSEKGNALALNAGLGNLGVSVVQFLVPLVITAGVFGSLGGEPLTGLDKGVETRLWLQNAGFVWIPFIIASSLLAWLGMNDIASAKASFAEQSVIFTRRHNWLMCWLYTGTFGSFIGFSAALPLLIKATFPEVNALAYAWVGPLVGAASRAATGWIADRFGGARVTLVVFAGLIGGVLGVLYFLHLANFAGFFACFLVLFFLTGVGNASTFQMIPNIMRKEIARLEPHKAPDDQRRQAEKESAAITGFTSAIAAYGAFFIPKSYGTAITLTGAPDAALWGFLIFYASCALLTWALYVRRGSLLWDIESRPARPPSPQPAQ